MEIINTSNFPKRVEGVKIAPGESEEVDIPSEDRLEELRQNNSFEVVEPETTETEDEDSKSEEKEQEEGE